MTFVSATQTTDLDRVDNIHDVIAAASRYRAAGIVSPNVATHVVVGIAKTDSATAEYARAELIARYEPQLRKAANRARIAPQTDRQQAALTGFLSALQTYDASKGVDLYTHAHPYVIAEVRNANREHSPRPAAERNQAYYWSAMDCCDGDANKARHYLGLMRLSVDDLEPLADAGDMLAREILDKRLDQFDAAVLRDGDDAPEWEEYAARTGRGLDGPTFDAIHAGVTYLDAAAELDDGDGDTGHDIVADPNAADPFEAIVERFAFDEMLDTLEGRELEIMQRTLRGQTDRDIADAVELSRPRVVNIRAGIVKRFRKMADG